MGKYEKIEIGLGITIDSAITELKKHEGLVCIEINGRILYSDIDDIESAYKKLTGKTKSEFDEALRKRQAEYEREMQGHEEAISKLTKEWIDKGSKILDQKHHELWGEIVPIRLKDFYRGLELGACLDIIEQLNNNCQLSEAKAIIEEQGHTGMSFHLVCSMIKEFCERGDEFVNYIKAQQFVANGRDCIPPEVHTK